MNPKQAGHFLYIGSGFFLIVIGQQVQKITKKGRDGHDQRIVFGICLEVINNAVGFEMVFPDEGTQQFKAVEIFADTGMFFD